MIRRIAKRTRKSTQRHVLVIDEINRANISKVMGELITLIEADKRERQANEVRVTLPHSQEPFSLPDNLYILGTMNTADRSIALLDVALRRRFDFEEMLPKPELLQDAEEETGIELPKVLETINKRLEYLIDRDHLIGHAWLMQVESRDELDACMRRKIIPLIAEYFFEDWSKVHAVLGGGFLSKEELEPLEDMSDDTGDDRYSWRLRDNFEASAYDELIGQSKLSRQFANGARLKSPPKVLTEKSQINCVNWRRTNASGSRSPTLRFRGRTAQRYRRGKWSVSSLFPRLAWRFCPKSRARTTRECAKP